MDPYHVLHALLVALKLTVPLWGREEFTLHQHHPSCSFIGLLRSLKENWAYVCFGRWDLEMKRNFYEGTCVFCSAVSWFVSQLRCSEVCWLYWQLLLLSNAEQYGRRLTKVFCKNTKNAVAAAASEAACEHCPSAWATVHTDGSPHSQGWLALAREGPKRTGCTNCPV